MARIVRCQAQWDPEAGVWWAVSTNVRGIVTESPTLDALRERLKLLVPDFLESMDEVPDDVQIDLEAFVSDIVEAA